MGTEQPSGDALNAFNQALKDVSDALALLRPALINLTVTMSDFSRAVNDGTSPPVFSLSPTKCHCQGRNLEHDRAAHPSCRFTEPHWVASDKALQMAAYLEHGDHLPAEPWSGDAEANAVRAVNRGIEHPDL